MAIVTQNAAVVPHAPVQNGHAKVAQQIVRGPPLQQLGQALPAVPVRVGFQEVILAAVSRQLQLGPEAVRRPALPRQGAGSQRPLEVAGKVQGPLVQVARCHGHHGGGGVVVVVKGAGLWGAGRSVVGFGYEFLGHDVMYVW